MTRRIFGTVLVGLGVLGLLLGCATGFPLFSGGPPQVYYVIRTEPEMDVAPGSEFTLVSAQAAESVVLDEVGPDELATVLDTLNADIEAGLATFDHSVVRVTVPLDTVQAALYQGTLPGELGARGTRYWITALVTGVSRDSEELQIRYQIEYDVPTVTTTVGPGGVPQVRTGTRTERETVRTTMTREWFDVELQYVVYDAETKQAVVRSMSAEQPISGSSSVKGYDYPSAVRPIMESIEPHEYPFSTELAGGRTRNPQLREAHKLAARVGPTAAFPLYQRVWEADEERDAGFNTALIMLQDARFEESYAILRKLRQRYPDESGISILAGRLEYYLFDPAEPN
jgi:hypothetical protein